MPRVAPILLCAAIALSAQAADLEVRLQEGTECYAGTQDFMMYAPSSVAFVNYGAHNALTAGINRWGEKYASIIRFDLTDLPAGAKVTGARLILHATSPDFPTRDLPVQLHQLTAANGDWVEGEGDGTRDPIAGTPCWSFRRHDTDKWAGEPGAMKPGVDFSTDWVAEATVKAKAKGPAVFELPIAAVQGWLDSPGTNTGLHIWPPDAKDKGDVAYLASSEAQEQELRPELVITLQYAPEIAAALSRSKAQRALAAAEKQYQSTVAASAAAGNPPRAREALGGAAQRLSALQRALTEAKAVDEAMAKDLLAEAADLVRAVDEIALDLPRASAAAWNQEHGLRTDFALGTASSMVKVLRRDQPFSGEITDCISLRLARNEHEAAQVVVIPVDKGLRNVTWELRGLQAEGITARVAPVGYVKSKVPALTTPTAPSDWWPHPLLTFKSSFDVPQGEVQPLWLDVHASEYARAGALEGQLIVRANAAQPKRMRIRVQVYDFTVPRQQHLKTIWGMTEANFSKYYKGSYDERFAWKYFDMFLDHRMSAADLYRTIPNGIEGEDSIYHLANVDALRRVKQRGSGWWNVGYVLAPEHVERGLVEKLSKDYDTYLTKCVELFKTEVERLKAAEWPEDRMGIYFLDETSNFEALGKAAKAMKEAFPDIPLMTTGYDRSYGLEDSVVSKSLDIWVPLTPRYREDQSKIVDGRKLGKQAWWYTCCAPIGSKDLNWFTQFPAIRARLLMGVAARRYAVDGYLYYRCCGWTNNPGPIPADTDICTDWVPQYSGTLPDGDGQIVCAGPAGPLPTIALENIRDGLEDYEYYWVLEDLLRQADAGRLSGARQGRVEELRGLLEVPESVLSSITQYSEDPQVLLLQRDKVAAGIVELQQILRAQRDEEWLREFPLRLR